MKLHFQIFLNNGKEDKFALKWKLLFTYALKELSNKGSNIEWLEIKLTDLAMLKEKKSTFLTFLFKRLISHLMKLQIQKDLYRRGRRVLADSLSLLKETFGQKKDKTPLYTKSSETIKKGKSGLNAGYNFPVTDKFWWSEYKQLGNH